MALVAYLCIMSTHGPIAPEGASRVAISGIWKSIVFNFIIPWLHKLKNGSISVERNQLLTHINYYLLEVDIMHS